jgi:hypothetical protein
MKRINTLAGFLAALLTTGFPAFAAENDGIETSTETELETDGSGSSGEKTCVLLRSIDRTDVIDDYNILFYMRGPDIFHVRLPHRCPGLRAADSFMYSTSLNVLCDLDIIRPLRNFGGGFTPGPACGMGRFTPITKEEVKFLKNKDVKVEAERAEPDIEALDTGDADSEEDATESRD